MEDVETLDDRKRVRNPIRAPQTESCIFGEKHCDCIVLVHSASCCFKERFYHRESASSTHLSYHRPQTTQNGRVGALRMSPSKECATKVDNSLLSELLTIRPIVCYSKKKGGVSMARTKAMIRASKKYEAETVERIALRVPKGRKAEIQAYADKHGVSINVYINQLIYSALKQEGVDTL